MAGGAIIVTQRERADKYNGRFTIFTFVAIICGATTGLVRFAWPIAATVHIFSQIVRNRLFIELL